MVFQNYLYLLLPEKQFYYFFENMLIIMLIIIISFISLFFKYFNIKFLNQQKTPIFLC
jgi:hypothetical protein